MAACRGHEVRLQQQRMVGRSSSGLFGASRLAHHARGPRRSRGAGASPASACVRSIAAGAAGGAAVPRDGACLQGETGTGKEACWRVRLARAFLRATGQPFVVAGLWRRCPRRCSEEASLFRATVRGRRSPAAVKRITRGCSLLARTAAKHLPRRDREHDAETLQSRSCLRIIENGRGAARGAARRCGCVDVARGDGEQPHACTKR